MEGLNMETTQEEKKETAQEDIDNADKKEEKTE